MNDLYLPNTVLPLHYTVHTDIDLNTCTFDGQVQIKLDVRRKKREIVLNAKHLSIISARLQGQNLGIGIKPKKVFTTVPILFEGESPAAKDPSATEVELVEEIAIASTPDALPTHFSVDLSTLKKCGEKVTVSDLDAPRGVKILANPKGVVAFVEHTQDVQKTKDQLSDDEKIKESPEQKAERVRLVFDKTLEPGKYTLTLWFVGQLNTKMKGLYQSTYTVDGEEKVMATTQLEDIHARWWFPCFDQPNMKAPHRFTASVPMGTTAISNMPDMPDSPFESGGKMFHCFEETPPMSTYLGVLVVGELEHIEATTKNGTHLRAFTTPGKVEKVRFGLEVSKHSLEFLEDFNGVPFPLPKLDFTSVPDFAFGAMENWGGIVFRELLFFVDENTSKGVIERVVEVTPHEIQHMWAGNDVTMKDWSDLWLNEGVTTCVTQHAMDYVSKTMGLGIDVFKTTYNDITNPALLEDALRTTHPVRVPVTKKEEVGQNFDLISYQKGASTVNMLIDYLGLPLFKKCLKEYFETYHQSNANTNDFFKSFEKTSGMPVSKFLGPWINDPGYPMVTVEKTNADGSHLLMLSQKRFLSSGAELTPKEKRQKWHVPITVLYKNGETENIVLTRHAKTIQLVKQPAENILKLNAGQRNFCRINYSEQMWQNIISALKKGQLKDPVDRAGIVSDATALSKAGLLPATTVLEIISTLRDEKEFIVWQQILSALSAVSFVLTKEQQGHFDLFARYHLQKIATHLGWESEPDEDYYDSLLRPFVLNAYGSYGHSDTVETARQLYEDHYFDGQIDPDLRFTILNLVAKSETDTARLTQGYLKTEKDPEENLRFLMALASFKNDDQITTAMEFLLSPKVRGGNMVYFFRQLGANQSVVNASWEFFKANFQKFKEKFGPEMYTAMATRVTAGRMSTTKDANDVEQFFNANPFPEGKQKIDQTIEMINTNAKRIARDRENVALWLKNWYSASFSIKDKKESGLGSLQ